MEKQRFAVFDIDGTLVRWQLYHAVANALLKQSGNRKLYDHIRSARRQWKQRSHSLSFREYESTLVQAYEATLQQISATDFNQAADAAVNEYKDQVYTFTRDLIAELKEKGYFLLAISGSQQELVEKIAAYYEFDDCVGTVYEQKDGRFTGQKILGSSQKHKVLEHFITTHNLTIQGSCAVGDSESDIPMLAMVDNPIAFNPTAALLDEARQQKWSIVVERKNVVYKLDPHNGAYLLA